MDLSIVIVNWNSRDHLAKALASVVAQVSGLSYEIVVIDSGSFDGCAEMLQQSYPGVRFLQSVVNLGFAKANNEAVRVTSGRVLLFLNPDTEVLGTAVQELFWQLVSLPTAGIVGPTLLNTDGTIQDTCVRAFPTVLNQVLDAELLRRWFPRAALWGMRTLLARPPTASRVDAVSGACLMMKRSAFEAAGRFSTDYFMYAEDMDLCLMAARAGFTCHHVPAAVVVHHGGGSSARTPTSSFSAVMALESQWRYFRKTRSPGYAALYRVAMGGASIVRVTALLCAWPVHRLRARGGTGGYPLAKWFTRLRWALGGERWVRNI